MSTLHLPAGRAASSVWGASRPYKLSRRLNLWVLAVVTTVVSAFGAFGYLHQARTLEEQLQQQLGSAVSRMAVGLPEAVWNYDEGQIGKILRAEMSLAAIDGVEVRNGTKFLGGVVRSADRTVASAAQSSQFGSEGKLDFELTVAEGAKKSVVGTAVIHFNRAHTRAALADNLMLQALQVLVLNVLIVVAVSLVISRTVLRPLKTFGDALHDIGAGQADLRQRLPSMRSMEFQRVADGFNVFVARLEVIVRDVQRHAKSSASSVRTIAKENSSLAARTEAQAASLQQTASAIEELTSTIRQNTESAALAERLAKTGHEVVNQGSTIMSEVIPTMHELNKSSSRMSDIIGVINGIAFQTNILALNAAVEAARAGEQGRGFAVVANEVRTLAQRSAVAAKEIKDLIGSSVERVECGTSLVINAGRAMDEIVTSIHQLGATVAQITDASRQQLQGIEQINSAVADIDKATQSNAAFVDQTSASTAAVSQQVEALAGVIEVFQVDDTPELKAA